jgi:hypothetical protein
MGTLHPLEMLVVNPPHQVRTCIPFIRIPEIILQGAADRGFRVTFSPPSAAAYRTSRIAVLAGPGFVPGFRPYRALTRNKSLALARKPGIPACRRDKRVRPSHLRRFYHRASGRKATAVGTHQHPPDIPPERQPTEADPADIEPITYCNRTITYSL